MRLRLIILYFRQKVAHRKKENNDIISIIACRVIGSLLQTIHQGAAS